MAASRAWARADLRGRWRSLVVLGVLVGVVGGLAAASVAGARRTGTAFERLRQRTNAADAIVFPGQVGVYQADWSRLTDRPEVAQVAVWNLSFGQVFGQEQEMVLFVPADDVWLGEVDRPVVLEGRMFDPNAPDEVVIGEEATRVDIPGEARLHVGSVIPYRPFTIDQDDTSGVAPDGPEVELHVVGVVRHVHELLFVPGMIMVSPAFLDSYGVDTLLVANAMVRLTHGSADVPQLRSDVNELVAPGAPVDDLHVAQRRVDTTIGVERSALILLAAAIAIAGLMLVGQALGRSVSIPYEDGRVLRAMGFDRPSLAVSSALVHLVVAVTGALITLALAIVASHWFPIGLAARIDPDRGLHADWPVLLTVALVVVVAVLATALAAGWRAGRARSAESLLAPSKLAARIGRVSPITVALGTTMAFRRSDRSGGRARPALVGAVVGVLGVVGTMTIDRGLTDALEHPARAGVTWDATVSPVPQDRTVIGVAQSRVDSVAAVPGVAGVAVVTRLVSEVNGVGVPMFSVQSGAGRIGLSTVSGRAPAADGEAAIGPATARQLDVAVGDTVSVGSLARNVRIVGEALFPADVHAGFDEGLWLTSNDLASIESPVPADDVSGPERLIAVRFRPETDPADGIEAIAEAQGGSIAGISPVEVPPELTNLRNVRTLPRLLAGFLALLAAAAVAHVLITSVRRRRRDFATLRALGMTKKSVRAILHMQGTATALAGLVVGIPLGIAIGRVGWRLVTLRVPLDFVGPSTWTALAVLIPIAVVVVNLLAVLPGRRASRLHPAEVLREE